MMSKGRTVKDLTQINNLFGPQVVEQPFAVQLAEHNAKPAPVMDIADAIIDLMKNYRGWTVGDVGRCLAKHPDSYLIPTLMNKFATEGKFEIMQATGNANTYTLKKQTEARSLISLAPQKPWTQREEDVRKAPDQMAVIRLEEGMDVSIWKVMADFKPRTAKDIRAILVEYRFDARHLDRRIDTFIRSNRWFEREHKRSGTVYVLKKGFPMPAIPKTPMNTANQNDLAGIRTNLSAPQHAQQELSITKHSEEAVMAIDQAVAEARAEQQAEEAPYAQPHIEPTDTMAVAIWKAMSDHKPYRAADVFVLVSSAVPNTQEQSIYARLSAMYGKEMLTRERDPDPKSRSYVYTLKLGVACPTMRPVGPRSTSFQPEAPAAAPAAEQAAPTQPQETQEDNTMAQTAAKPLVVVRSNPEAVAAPLFEMTIKLKGELFTSEECRQLVQELKALNITGQSKRDPGLVKQIIEIKGISFTLDELNDVVRHIAANGLTK